MIVSVRRHGGVQVELDVAYMEAISAIETLTNMKPLQQMKNIQMAPAVPPLTRPIVETLFACVNMLIYQTI